MYKYFDKEYHYLQKKDRLYKKQNYEIKNAKPENVKLKDQIERCYNKLEVSTRESDNFQKNF